MTEQKEIEALKYQRNVIVAVAILGIFILSYMYFGLQQENQIQKQSLDAYDTYLKSPEVTFNFNSGKSVSAILDTYAEQFNISKTQMIVDCEKYAIFADQHYGICFIRDKSLNESKLITIRTNFTKVD